MQQRITEMTLIPDGMDWDDVNRPFFGVRVVYRGVGPQGKDLYAVFSGPGDFQVLSRAGNWAFTPERFRWRQYRWETLDEALLWARKSVNDVKVNGRTWAEWQRFHGRS